MAEPSRRALAASTRVLVVLPTFNEIDSLPRVLNAVFAAAPDADVLVVDDNSPDGTGVLVQERAVNEPHLHVMQRASKLGLGSAYKAGFACGLQQGFEVFVQMDSDGSHAPRALPSLLGELEGGADLALGSRYVEGGSTPGWRSARLLLSRTSNALARQLLELPVRDATGGYRAYWAETLRAIDVASVACDGYAFQVETLWRAVRAGLRIAEVPIAFRDRQFGASKISRQEVCLAALTLLRLGRSAQRSSARARGSRPVEAQA